MGKTDFTQGSRGQRLRLTSIFGEAENGIVSRPLQETYPS